MTERIDHAADAVKTINETLSYGGYGEDAGAIASMLAAQVHATLALVEQQRIANLIAYAAHRNDHQSAIGDHYPDALRELLSDADFAIRMGLGL